MKWKIWKIEIGNGTKYMQIFTNPENGKDDKIL